MRQTVRVPRLVKLITPRAVLIRPGRIKITVEASHAKPQSSAIYGDRETRRSSSDHNYVKWVSSFAPSHFVPSVKMIAIASPFSRPSSRHWRSSGGFLWWYFDHLDANGTGCVCILSYALPFLPGITSAARRGVGFTPEQNPSLNVVVYADGQPVDYYLITGSKSRAAYEFSEEPGRLIETFEFGESTLTIDRDRLKTRFCADLQLPIAGTAGTYTKLSIRAEGPTIRSHASELHVGPSSDESDVSILLKEREAHRWAMICPNLNVTARVDWPDGRHLAMSGHGYLDRNDSTAAIDRLGIDWWLWGRVLIDNTVYIWYVLEAQAIDAPKTAIGFEIRGGGAIVQRALTMRQTDSRRTLFGMRRSSGYQLFSGDKLWLELTEQSVIDDGPFYLRTMQRVAVPGGNTTLGFCELVRPERVDLARHRPLVRMRVLNFDEPSSLWLPLFSGPRRSRWRRLIRGWLELLHSTKSVRSETPPAQRLE